MSFFLAVESLHLHRMKRTGWMQFLFVILFGVHTLLVLFPIGSSDFSALYAFLIHPEQWMKEDLTQSLSRGNWLFLGIQELVSALGMMMGLGYTYLFLRDLPSLGREEASVQDRFLKFYPEMPKTDSAIPSGANMISPFRATVLIVAFAFLSVLVRWVSALFFMIPYLVFFFWSYYWLPYLFFTRSFSLARRAAAQTLRRSWPQILWGQLFLYLESQFLAWLFQSASQNMYWIELSQGLLLTYFAFARGRLMTLLFLGYGRLSDCVVEERAFL